MFGLGWAEVIILGLICGLPVIIGVVAVVVVLIVSKKPPSQSDFRDDDRALR